MKGGNMSNPFKWYVYVSVDGGPWQRHREYPRSEKGRQEAVGRARVLGRLIGIESKAVQERRGEEE